MDGMEWKWSGSCFGSYFLDYVDFHGCYGITMFVRDENVLSQYVSVGNGFIYKL